ncbi:MAG: septum site-determining protein MinC [Vampirovibrionales bacterium]|nr:septum site-determining protein MinC [Vampirovibrionales bacterium]
MTESMANPSFQNPLSAEGHNPSAQGRNAYAELPNAAAKAPVSTVARSGIIDVSGAANSAQALLMVEEALLELQGIAPKSLDLNSGHLLLTRAVLSKIGLLIKKHHIALHTVYSKVPQTQQAALDEGYFVKEAPTRPQPSSIEQLHRHLEKGTATQVAFQQAAQRNPQQTLVGTLLAQQETMHQSQAASFTLPDHLPELGATLQSQQGSAQKIDTDKIELLFDFDGPSPTHTTVAAKSAKHDVSDTNVPQSFVPTASANASPTLLVKGTLRSGQVLRYAGNLVVLGDAHAGSEITADGDIVIWGELRGIAHAGASGYSQAEIRAMKIEAIQLRIGDHIARRPDRMFYHKPLANQLPTPEVARVYQGEIRVFKESLGIK